MTFLLYCGHYASTEVERNINMIYRPMPTGRKCLELETKHKFPVYNKGAVLNYIDIRNRGFKSCLLQIYVHVFRQSLD